jgi:hypothetical protein
MYERLPIPILFSYTGMHMTEDDSI